MRFGKTVQIVYVTRFMTVNMTAVLMTTQQKLIFSTQFLEITKRPDEIDHPVVRKRKE